MTDQDSGGGVDPYAETQMIPAVGGPRPPGAGAPRRKVLFAAGGLTLVAGCGAAVAATAGGGGGAPKAVGAASGIPGARKTPSPRASASQAASTPPVKTSPQAGSTTLPPGTVAPTAPQWYVDDEGAMAIALTMDDGPNPVYTPQVLEVLAHYHVPATFNMIGRQVGDNLSLVREVSAAGHTVTNHTWDHADLTHYTFAQVCSEIDRTNDALADADQTPQIFRAPYGNWSKAVFQACAARRLRPVGWSVDPRDWDTAHVDTAEIVANVLHNTRAHSIILEHDGGGVRANTVAALKIFIPALQARGFRFVAM